jgi:hypothetical protein
VLVHKAGHGVAAARGRQVSRARGVTVRSIKRCVVGLHQKRWMGTRVVSLFARPRLITRMAAPRDGGGSALPQRRQEVLSRYVRRVSRSSHRPREDELAHPAHTSRSNLASALGLLSSGTRVAFEWRLSKPQPSLASSRCREELCSSPFLRMTEVKYTRPPWERERRWQMVERPTSRQRDDPTFTDGACRPRRSHRVSVGVKLKSCLY